MPPLTSYLLLFSYSIKHIQIYTICRKTDDCTLHIIKKRKQKNKNQFVNCRHSPPSIVSEIQIQQKLYLKITRLPNTQQIFSYYTCAIPIVFFFSIPLLNNPFASVFSSHWLNCIHVVELVRLVAEVSRTEEKRMRERYSRQYKEYRTTTNLK